MAIGYSARSFALLKDQSASANGDWFLAGRLNALSVTIEGLEAGGSVDIRLSNRPENDPPPAEYLGVPRAGSAFTSDLASSIVGGSATFIWIRAIKTAGGTPTPTSVYLAGQTVR